MFKQEFTGVGATLEKRWKFCAFEGIKTVWLWLVMKLCRRIPRAWQGYKVLKQEIWVLAHSSMFSKLSKPNFSYIRDVLLWVEM